MNPPIPPTKRPESISFEFFKIRIDVTPPKIEPKRALHQTLACVRLQHLPVLLCYLRAIGTHATDAQARPSAWLPSNYPQSINPAGLDHDPPGLPA